MKTLDPTIKQKVIDLRRELHQHPELSWKELETAKRISHFLDSQGISYQAGVAQHGIVAELPGVKSGPYIALRADMDALPIAEETGLEFCSKAKGVMHACGHDGHMSMLVGATLVLQQIGKLEYPIKLVFQPAEELGEGAKTLMATGALDDVEMIFGGHVDLNYQPGTIMVTAGAVNASSDNFFIDIHGQGAHGARPHQGIDAVVVGSLIVTSLQTIVSRDIDPAAPSVVSVGEFKAGTKSNVIAGHAYLSGTIRAQTPEVRSQLMEGVTRIVETMSELHGAKAEVRFEQGTPPLINTEDMAKIGKAAAAEAVGADNVVPPNVVNMGGEDFSYYLEKLRGCYVRYGAKLQGRESYPAHSSQFDFDEKALEVGSLFLAQAAVQAAEALKQERL